MGILDDITGIFDNITGKDLAGIGGIFGNYIDRGNKNDALVNAYKAREQQNFNDQKAQYDYINNVYNPAVQAYQASSAAAARNAAGARAAAARQTEENRLRAGKKGMKTEQKYYEQALGNIQPWIDTGHQLLPEQAKTYGNALSGLQLAQAYLQSPAYMAKFNQSVPAYSIDIPLPDYLKR